MTIQLLFIILFLLPFFCIAVLFAIALYKSIFGRNEAYEQAHKAFLAQKAEVEAHIAEVRSSMNHNVLRDEKNPGCVVRTSGVVVPVQHKESEIDQIVKDLSQRMQSGLQNRHLQ